MLQLMYEIFFLVAISCPMPAAPDHGHISYDLFDCSGETCNENTHAFFYM